MDSKGTENGVVNGSEIYRRGHRRVEHFCGVADVANLVHRAEKGSKRKDAVAVVNSRPPDKGTCLGIVSRASPLFILALLLGCFHTGVSLGNGVLVLQFMLQDVVSSPMPCKPGRVTSWEAVGSGHLSIVGEVVQFTTFCAPVCSGAFLL